MVKLTANDKEQRKTIYLLRHAHSDDALPPSGDFSRPLSDKGRKQVQALCNVCKELKIKPDVVFCSPALRTSQTLEELGPALEDSNSSFDESLYLASAFEIRFLINMLDEEIQSVMIIAHNSGIEDLAWSLSDEKKSDEASYQKMMKKFPPCGLAIISFVGSWADLREKKGSLLSFIRPKDILGEK